MARDRQYEVDLNEGALSMRWLEDRLNDRWRDGWALHSIFEQAGNTVIVFERRAGH